MAGEYVCKAFSAAGTVSTKAQLRVYELTGEALEEWEAKKAKRKQDKLDEDQAKQAKKAAKMTKADYLKQAQDEREKEVKKQQKMADSEAKEKEAQETAAKIAKAKSLSAAPKQVCLSDIMLGADETVPKKSEKTITLSQKKVPKNKEEVVEEGMTKFIETKTIGLRSVIEAASQESLSVIDIATQDKNEEFHGETLLKEFAKVDTLLKSGATVDQIITLGTTGDLPVLKAPESQSALVQLVENQGFKAITREVMVLEATKLAPQEPIGLKAVLRAVEEKTANMEEVVGMALNPEEFNLKTRPVVEMAQISTFLNEGISCQEVLALVQAGDLPALRQPETQWPLVQVMDKLGHSATVSQVIVEEPTLNLETSEMQTTEEKVDKFISTQSIGLRSLLKMAVQESLNTTDIVSQTKTEEVVSGPAPFQDCVKIDTMLKSGVTVEQITDLDVTDSLQILTSPESQTVLVQMVQDRGCTAVTRQVRKTIYIAMFNCTVISNCPKTNTAICL